MKHTPLMLVNIQFTTGNKDIAMDDPFSIDLFISRYGLRSPDKIFPGDTKVHFLSGLVSKREISYEYKKRDKRLVVSEEYVVWRSLNRCRILIETIKGIEYNEDRYAEIHDWVTSFKESTIKNGKEPTIRMGAMAGYDSSDDSLWISTGGVQHDEKPGVVGTQAVGIKEKPETVLRALDEEVEYKAGDAVEKEPAGTKAFSIKGSWDEKGRASREGKVGRPKAGSK